MTGPRLSVAALRTALDVSCFFLFQTKYSPFIHLRVILTERTILDTGVPLSKPGSLLTNVHERLVTTCIQKDFVSEGKKAEKWCIIQSEANV